MKILIRATSPNVAEFCKNTLEEFGKGMHISIINDISKPNSVHWSCIIKFATNKELAEENANNTIEGKEESPKLYSYLSPETDEQFSELRRSLWALYRDELSDMIGGKCSCGLYDICHCH